MVKNEHLLRASLVSFAVRTISGCGWGCDSSPGSVAPTFVAGSEALAQPGVPPCYDDQTLGDLLDQKNVSWKYDTGTIGTFDGGFPYEDGFAKLIWTRSSPIWLRAASRSFPNEATIRRRFGWIGDCEGNRVERWEPPRVVDPKI